MMRKNIIILLCSLLACTGSAWAQTDSSMLSFVQPKADSVAVEDSLSDEEIMKMLAKQSQTDTVRKVVDKGVDVSKMVNSKRMRPVDDVVFESSPFMKNTFFTLGVTSHLLELDNHSPGLEGSISFGKWLHEDHAVRAMLSMGEWRDNYDFSYQLATQLDVSYIFNISSFVNGYRPNRFCDICFVAGVGYANATQLSEEAEGRETFFGNAFDFHVGARLNLRVFKSLDFFIEPQVVGYTNGITVYEGSWRGIKPAFRGSVGLSYNVMQSYGSDSPRLLPRKSGYFINLTAGPHFQNSSLVYEVGLQNCIGVHVALGVGKNYTDYFAMRYSFAYSRNPWIAYAGETYPCNYFALRAEGIWDVLSFARYIMFKGENTRHKFLSASVLFGPEAGYMNKKDRSDAVQSFYFGVSGGAQVKFRLTPMISLYLEPRFSIVPYPAKAQVGETDNKYRNYYDGVMNFNAGIEVNL